MAIAHVCMQCGRDLGRCRPLRDPYYHLPIVICPDCGYACVRQLHPILRLRRRELRLRVSLRVLTIQLLCLLLLALANWSGAEFLLDYISYSQPIAYLLHADPFVLVGSGLIIPLLTGIWLTVAFPHWKYGMQWVAWVLLIVILISLDPIVVPSIKHLIPNSAEAPWRSDVRFADAGSQLAAFGVMLAVSLTGILLGKMILLVYVQHRSILWCKRRTRLRKQRLGR
ncbi:MAG: hypothetical protein KAS72_09585 [Phycisphaerales bacterium]|nr:hypothetical protein [Phycisphaerales bacterium]